MKFCKSWGMPEFQSIFHVIETMLLTGDTVQEFIPKSCKCKSSKFI